MIKWMVEASIRFKNDFTDHWRVNGTAESWENHRTQFLGAWKQVENCVTIIRSQIEKNQCVPRPPFIQNDLARAEGVMSRFTDPGPFGPPAPTVPIPEEMSPVQIPVVPVAPPGVWVRIGGGLKAAGRKIGAIPDLMLRLILLQDEGLGPAGAASVG